MMDFPIAPKEDWVAGNGIAYSDLNRIESNTKYVETYIESYADIPMTLDATKVKTTGLTQPIFRAVRCGTLLTLLCKPFEFEADGDQDFISMTNTSALPAGYTPHVNQYGQATFMMYGRLGLWVADAYFLVNIFRSGPFTFTFYPFSHDGASYFSDADAAISYAYLPPIVLSLVA